MEALKINTILKKGGEIFIRNLPLDKGDEVEITLLFRTKPVRKTVFTATAADLLIPNRFQKPGNTRFFNH